MSTTAKTYTPLKSNRLQSKDKKKAPSGEKDPVDTSPELDMKEEENSLKIGDNIHLGIGAKGGAGYRGKVTKIEGDNIHATSHIEGKYGKRTFKGHVKMATKEEFEIEEEDDADLEEALSLRQRIKKGIVMRRYAPKLAVARRRAMRRRAQRKVLTRRSRKQAIKDIKTKFSGGRDIKKLSAAEKSRLETIVKKRKMIVNRLAKKLYIGKKQSERKRLNDDVEISLNDVVKIMETALAQVENEQEINQVFAELYTTKSIKDFRVVNEGFEMGKVHHMEFKNGERSHFIPLSTQKNGRHSGLAFDSGAAGRSRKKPVKTSVDPRDDFKLTPDHEIPDHVRNHMNEEVKPLDEISKQKARDYFNKANDDTLNMKTNHDSKLYGGKGKDITKNILRKYDNRQKGISQAYKKMTKEEVKPLDEISANALRSYIDKAKKDARDKNSERLKNNDFSKVSKITNRLFNVSIAKDKLRPKEAQNEAAPGMSVNVWLRQKAEKEAKDKDDKEKGAGKYKIGPTTKPVRMKPSRPFKKNYYEETEPVDEEIKQTLKSFMQKVTAGNKLSKRRGDKTGRIKAQLKRPLNYNNEEVEVDEERLIKAHEHPTSGKSAKVYHNSDLGEYKVKHFKFGHHYQDADYHTNDKSDAHDTAKTWIKEEVELDELSKAILKRYVSKGEKSQDALDTKAVKQWRSYDDTRGHSKSLDTQKASAAIYTGKKADKRAKYLNKADEKLAKEENVGGVTANDFIQKEETEPLDELSARVIRMYRKNAEKYISKKDAEKKTVEKEKSTYYGMDNKPKKISESIEEEVNPLEEAYVMYEQYIERSEKAGIIDKLLLTICEHFSLAPNELKDFIASKKDK